MSRFLKFSSGLVFVITSLLATSAKAQFERVNAIVSAVESKFEERYGALPTTETIAEIKDNAILKQILLSPLQWEVKKIQLQSSLLEEKNDSIEVKIESSQRKLLAISVELFEQGIHDEQDLSRLLAEQRESKKQIEIAKLEIEALELVGENDREEEKRNIDLAQAELQLETLRSVVEQRTKSHERNESLYKQGTIPTHAIELGEAELQQAVAKLKSLELEMQKVKIETQPGYSNELRLAMARLEKLLSNEKLEALSAESFAQLQSLVKSKQELTMAVAALMSEQALVQGQLATLNLEQHYLKSVTQSFSDLSSP